MFILFFKEFSMLQQRFDPWVRKSLWSRKWHPAPVFLPGKFHGQKSLTGGIQLSD